MENKQNGEFHENELDRFLDIHIKQARNLRLRLEAGLAQLDNRIKLILDFRYDYLKKNKNECRRFIVNEVDSQARWAALQLLLREAPDAETAEFCTTLVRSSEIEPKIRALALRGLYNYYSWSKDMSTGILFVEVLSDVASPLELVRMAYRNILDLLGIPGSGELRQPTISTISPDPSVIQRFVALNQGDRGTVEGDAQRGRNPGV